MSDSITCHAGCQKLGLTQLLRACDGELLLTVSVRKHLCALHASSCTSSPGALVPAALLGPDHSCLAGLGGPCEGITSAQDQVPASNPIKLARCTAACAVSDGRLLADHECAWLVYYLFFSHLLVGILLILHTATVKFAYCTQQHATTQQSV